MPHSPEPKTIEVQTAKAVDPAAICSPLAERIADRLLTIRCTGVKCHRIAMKSGRYPDAEIDEGGLCRSALINEIQAALDDAANAALCEVADKARPN